MTQEDLQTPILFPVGISDYRKLVTENYLYIDKTLGINDILKESAISIICRPSRFGKTLFMSMLQHFFADQVGGIPTKDLFQNSLLAKTSPKTIEEHQGQYPVIFLTFKDLKFENFDEAYQGIKGLLERLFEEHQVILDSPLLSKTEKARFRRILKKTQDFEETRNALKDLSRFLFKVYKKPVVVLIDDSPILNTEYLDNKTNRFLKCFLVAGLKDNSSVGKAVLTGIMHVANESPFSDLNNTEVFSILKDSHSDSFGFTEQEVNQLLKKTNLSPQAEEIKQWYNGYKIGSQTIYNPCSIILCLKCKGKLTLYWVNTRENELIKTALSEASTEAKVQVEALMRGEELTCSVDEHIDFENLAQNETAFWSLLLFSGYLTAQEVRLDSLGYYQCDLRIPNQEVISLFRKQFVSLFEDRQEAFSGQIQ